MKTFTVSSPGHEPAGKLVHNHHFIIFDNVIHIPLEQSVGLECLVHMVQGFNVIGVI